MRKYIVIGLIIALIAIIWVIYGDFLLSYMGQKVPEVNIQDPQVLSLKRVQNEFSRESKELSGELSAAGSAILERIKNITFLATAVKSIFGR